MRIFKYPLVVSDRQYVTMPIGAELLTIQLQHGKPYLWAWVDEHAVPSAQAIMMCGTGQPFPEGKMGKYLGTLQLDGGDFIVHTFAGALGD